MVPTFYSYYFGEKGGVYREIDQEAEKIGESCVFVPSGYRCWTDGYLSTPLKMLALDRRMIKNSITYKYHAMVDDVIKKGKKVTGIRYVDENGLLHKAASRFMIDGTAACLKEYRFETQLGGALEVKRDATASVEAMLLQLNH